ncbi:MAG TPA: LysM peptidoglycan-binding domain-containing protein, partial [Chloroflexota bacterium]|nr:LysM peptidoglycan-binding domain-containing protein [Chloroflexota bacterium]
EHLVVKGDTLFSIARRNGVTIDALVAANGLPSRDALLPIGRTLDVPPQSTASAAPLPPTQGAHTVVKGDTLYSIARRANTSIEALVEANDLGSREAVLRVGRTLVIPAPGAPTAQMAGSVAPTVGAPTAGPTQERAPAAGRYTVLKGETLFSIARRVNTSVEALVAANGLGSRDAVLVAGRTLIIP